MQTVLFSIRHGETEWNAVGKWQGYLDSPLSANGIKQAHALAEGLADKQIEVLYSSDLGRAMQTAEIIAKKLSLDIEVDVRLRERNLGIIQGLTGQQFTDRFPKEATLFNSGDPDYIIPEGESARQRFDRSVECVDEIVEAHLGKRILIVTHGGVVGGFFYRALDILLSQPRRFSIFNASINTFSISNKIWQLDTWGEMTHLKNSVVLDGIVV